MAGIAQEKPKPYFHCGPSMESGFGKSHTHTHTHKKKSNKQI